MPLGSAPNTATGVLRVLVVDDSGFMCMVLRKIIEADGDLRVVGEARNGDEALARARELQPDVVTMDVEMPVMDGIEATRRILAEVRPAPAVIMVSGHTQSGAAATLEALRLGAADFVSKESTFAKTDLGYIDAQLRTKIRACAALPRNRRLEAAGQADRPPREAPRAVTRLAADLSAAPDLIVMAASTGGPLTLTTLLQAAGRLAVPIVIAQHMPEFFTACLAQSLAEDTGVAVREGRDREALGGGDVVIVPGGRDARIAPRAGGGFELRLADGAGEGGVHPSADILFESAAMAARRPVAVILTGMGDDGSRGAERLARRGLPVLVQRPDTCVIDGMPAAAIAAGVASDSLTLDEIAQRLRRWAAMTTPVPQVETAGPS
ncbi:MAG TPA: chemotaxis-specific protein-glutamate methyltransferase CheB [Stellaceae bacterium]|nr:chemotaxis-specific protein-glutamate methyltransferase CheB [Stellaceae bacterium]